MNLIDIIDEHGKLNYSKNVHIYRDSRMTYGELLSMSDALAVHLIEKFKDDKTPFVVYGHKQHDMLICFLACVKSGHAYIPVDSSMPDERIKDIIESSGTKLILSPGELKIDTGKTTTYSRDMIHNIYESYSGMHPEKKYQVGPEDTYYIIYTSGSTGRPKGVQITLSCLESFVNWGLKIADLDSGNQYVFMNQAPFSFDLSVMDLYLSLASGSTLFSVDKQMIANLKELFQYFEVSGINVWVSTPSFADMCLADKSFNSNLLPGLKLFLFCGEVLPNDCVTKLHERFEGARVINTYGPTEATVAVTSIIVDEELNNSAAPLPVGRVKDDCSIMIVDHEGRVVPEGERGEILIAGSSVSPGYYRNPEMTQKVFSEITIDSMEERCYRTGDEGYLKNGVLYYCGRMDFQVKLNGYRIELGDIENNLRKIDFISNAVVLPVYKNDRIQYLTGIVTLNRKFDEKDFIVGLNIKNELKKLLPEYMVPRKIEIRDILPMTGNGKVDRKALMEEIK